jgi:uncharacterized glyoxalase superfamily protein PhnB
MSTQAPVSTQTIYPCLSYAEAPVAIEWLTRAFDAHTLASYPGDEPGTIAHAELVVNGQVIMLGSPKPEKGWKSPRDLTGVNQAIYIVVDDPDAHCARARAAGAEIVMEPTTQDYGGRDYVARDLEGHQWCFGTYRPQL